MYDIDTRSGPRWAEAKPRDGAGWSQSPLRSREPARSPDPAPAPRPRPPISRPLICSFSACHYLHRAEKAHQPLWATFRGAKRETDAAMLADTVRVDLEGDHLWITLCTVTSVERLARRKTTLVERARQIIPSFPEVQFACGRFEEVRRAA
jgi:hypothetical protein